ncbi:UNVERIFIED_CONTAM: hypothetical protein LK11_49570 [Mumia flava]
MASAPRLDPGDLTLLRLLSTGTSWPAIGEQLHVSERTAHRQARDICDRIGVRRPIEAVVWAIREQLI